MTHTFELVDEFYRLLATRDTEGFNLLLADDVQVTYHATRGDLPWAGRFFGRQGFSKFLGIVGEHLEIAEAERQEPFGDHKRVVVATEGKWRVKANGAIAAGSMLNIFTIADRQICGYEVYADTAAFVKALDL
jgi:ketosteroid isomerase-like protein